MLLGIMFVEVVVCYIGSDWFVVFIGFVLGFVYFSGGDELLCMLLCCVMLCMCILLGVVVVVGGFSGVYLKVSFGGW